MEPFFIGQIMAFGGNFAPRGWALCDGQLLPIAQNTALFSILGTIYGGDGRTTFGLPDLRGRYAMHAGRGPGLTDRRLGVTGGAENVTLNQLQMPAYNMIGSGSLTGTVSVHVNEEDPAATEGNNATLGNTDSANIYNNDAADPTLKLGGVSHNLATNVTLSTGGGNLSHTNVPPFQVVNFIIALQGPYPSRS